MAMSPRGCPTENLVALCDWVIANGGRVTEMPPYDPVTGTHGKGSFHYDRDGKYGQAADITFGPAGASTGENQKLDLTAVVAQSMGLGVTWRAPGHHSHLHADVGMYSNVGGTVRTRTPGDIVTCKLQKAVNIKAAGRDNLWGDFTDERLEAVRWASAYKGRKFPHGVDTAQTAVGTDVDEIWGRDSNRRHDATVKKIQRILGVDDDGIWGEDTDRAYVSARTKYRR